MTSGATMENAASVTSGGMLITLTVTAFTMILFSGRARVMLIFIQLSWLAMVSVMLLYPKETYGNCLCDNSQTKYTAYSGKAVYSFASS